MSRVGDIKLCMLTDLYCHQQYMAVLYLLQNLRSCARNMLGGFVVNHAACVFLTCKHGVGYLCTALCSFSAWAKFRTPCSLHPCTNQYLFSSDLLAKVLHMLGMTQSLKAIGCADEEHSKICLSEASFSYTVSYTLLYQLPRA